eukprot:1515841-Prymnesium_polylepis.2
MPTDSVASRNRTRPSTTSSDASTSRGNPPPSAGRLGADATGVASSQGRPRLGDTAGDGVAPPTCCFMGISSAPLRHASGSAHHGRHVVDVIASGTRALLAPSSEGAPAFDHCSRSTAAREGLTELRELTPSWFAFEGTAHRQ